MHTAIGLLLIVGGLAGQDAPRPLATWTGTSPLAQARHSGCAVKLGDGRVLVSGGIGVDGPLASAELYLSDGTFVPAPAMIAARARHSCVLLADGRALVVGGDPNGTAELYDPQVDAWLPVDGTGQARFGATATVLRDRRVLIAGGTSLDGTTLASLEIFNPQDNTLRPLKAALSAPRDRFAAVLQSDNTVLFIGGINSDGTLNSTERFQPLDDSIVPGPMLNVVRAGHSATLLLDGRILVAGGSDGAQDLDSAEVYDPVTGAFQLLDAKMQTARRDHLAILVPGNGGVLLVGGSHADQALSATDLFVPAGNNFVALGDLTAPRSLLIGAVVADGLILAAGGLDSNGPQTACELILLPSIQFTKSPYRPGDQVQVSGSNFRPGTRVAFTLELVSGATVTLANNRLLTTAVTAPQGNQFQFFTGFGPIPILASTGADAGKTVLLIGQTPDGTIVQATVPVRIATSITLNQPTWLYEGLNGTFLAQLIRTVGPVPLTGQFSLSVTPNNVCAADGTSNTIIISEGPPPGAVTVNLFLTSSTAFLSKSVTNVSTMPLSVVATYGGDAAHDPASANACFRAVSRTPSLGLSTPPSNLLQVGSSFNLTATVNAQPGTPATNLTGTVNFFLDNFPLGPGQNSGATLVTALTSSRQFTPLSVGPISFTAQYGGDAFFRNAASTPLSVTIQKANTSVSLLNAPLTYHCDAPYSANVRLNFPAVVGLANTTVSLFTLADDGSVRGVAGSNATLAVTSPGVATATVNVASLPSSISNLQANFAGDGLLQGSTSTSIRPTLVTSPVTVEILAPQGAQANPVAINVRITPQGCSTLPTGNLEILDNGVPVTVVPVESSTLSGTSAVIVVANVLRTPGSHSIQARYSGDRVYQPATSAAAIIVFQ